MLQFDLKNVAGLEGKLTIEKVVKLYRDAGKAQLVSELVNLGSRIMTSVPLAVVFHGRRKIKPEVLKQFTDDKIPVFFLPKKEKLGMEQDYQAPLVTPEGSIVDEFAAVLSNVRLLPLGGETTVWGQTAHLIAGDFYINNPDALKAVSEHGRDALALMVSTTENSSVLYSLDGARFIKLPPVAVEKV